MINDMKITGIHATYWKELSDAPGNAQEKDQKVSHFKVFKRRVDAYMLAPIIGVMYSRKANKNLPIVKDDAGMMAEIQIKEMHKIMYIYRLVLLMDKTDETPEEKVNRIFRDDETNKEVREKNEKIFLDYFKGGLEYLYETFVEQCITDEDYIEKMVEFVNMFNAGDDPNALSERKWN